MLTRRSTLALVACCAAIALAGLPGLAAAQADKPLTIMTSLPNMAFPFFVHMMKQIKAEAEALGDITLIETDGQGSTPKQTADVEAAITQGVNGIVISPNEVDAMAPALQQAVDAGIPVVTIDRRVDERPGHPRPCRRRQRQGRRGPGQADHEAVPGRRHDHEPAGPAGREPGDRPQQGPAQRPRRRMRTSTSSSSSRPPTSHRDKGLSVTEVGARRHGDAAGRDRRRQ